MAVPEINFRDGQAQLKTVNGHLGTDGSFTFNSSPDTNVSTFSYTTNAVLTTLQGAYVAIQGSATKTVRLREIKLTGYSSDPPAFTLYKNFRASATGTTGSATWTEVTDPVSHEAAQAPTAKVYTISGVATSEPTAAGVQSKGPIYIGNFTDAASGSLQTKVWTFGDDGGQAMVLRGTSQYFILSNDLNAAGTAQTYWVDVKLTEEVET